ncbi:MAG: RNA polymerase sigma factor region1.1 domain-containing protein, partial [Thermoanaerobaculia bacterium]
MSTSTLVEEKFPAVRQLIEVGKEKGYLLYDEIYDLLPDEVVSLPDELDGIYIRFGELGIEVIDRPDRYRNREEVDEAEAVFEKREDETTHFVVSAQEKTNDPVRMYLREMG